MKKGMIYPQVGILIFLLLGQVVWAEKIGTLKEVFKPQMIKVFQNDLFVVEKHNYFIYALNGLQLKKKVGKLGEGPGEFQPDPARTIVITAFPEYIIGESRHKIVYFSRTGEYIKELRKLPEIIQTLPLGKNYAALHILYGQDGKNYFVVSIYSPEMKELKTIYKQKFFTFENSVFVMPDSLNYCVAGDKLFVDQSPDGFVIGVYDSEGNKLKEIRQNYKPIPVTTAQKEAAFNAYLDIPFFQRLIKEQGRAAAVTEAKKANLIYPDDYPPIQYMMVDNQKLYVKTYNKKNNKEEYLVMDLDGKGLKSFYLPEVRDVDFLVQMQGDKKYYTIHNNKFYYLKLTDVDDEEVWEVHMEPIRQ
jgi:hypothetical protein